MWRVASLMPNDSNKVNLLVQYINNVTSNAFAMQVAERGYAIADSIGFFNGRVRMTHHMGNIYYNMGDYEKAMETFLLEQQMLEKAGKQDRMASVYNGLGNACSGMGNDTAALMYYKLGLSAMASNPDKGKSSVFLNNIGEIYAHMRAYDSAYLYFNAVIRLGTKPGSNGYYTAACYEGIGWLFHDQHMDDSSLYYYELARETFYSIPIYQRISGVLSSMSDIYMARGEHQRAIDTLLHALEFAEGADNARALAYKGLAKAHYLSGNYEDAYLYQEKYLKLNDTLLNNEKLRVMNDMLAKYESAKKDKILSEKNAESKQHELQRNLFIGGFASMILLAFFIFRGYKQKKKAHEIIEKQKEEVEAQKLLVEHKNKEILDSINYAKRIQFTLLAHDEVLSQHLKSHFVLFNPKDIVSGDFYWAIAAEKKNTDGKTDRMFYLAVCDSTGHGVPGAFMSLLNISFLNEAVREKKIYSPEKILGYVRDKLVLSLGEEAQDGMDAILICIHQNTGEVQYTAANNPPVLVTNGVMETLPYDKMPVGKGVKNIPFTLHTLTNVAGARLYLSTDGYADQFGGPKGKKFRSKQLYELMGTIATLREEEQKEKLQNEFLNWKSELEQVDDVCIIGLTL